MNIFFDLDGTLVDSRIRLFKLFQHLVPQSKFTFDEYWLLKRNKNNHVTILNKYLSFNDEMVKIFEKKWMDSIEHPKCLAFDTIFEGVSEYLCSIKNKYNLHIITDRQFEKRTIKQIEEFGWANIFDKIMVTGQKIEKAELIRKNVKINPDDWFVGDTGLDIIAGKNLGINTAAVLTGFLNKEKIEEYEPDIILPSVLNFKIKN